MSFDLGDYVDVAERIRIFRDKYPDGCLQSEITFMQDGVFCRAYAYRTADTLPGIGHSFLKIPGSTPYTRDSEVENVETSAWGRAIVAALAADTKKVASADEVRIKSGAGGSVGGYSAGTGGTGAAVPSAVAPTEKQIAYLRRLLRERGFSEDVIGKPVDQLTKAEASQFIEQLKDGTFQAVQEFAEVGATLIDEDSLPF